VRVRAHRGRDRHWATAVRISFALLALGGCASSGPPGGGIRLAARIEFDAPSGRDLLRIDPHRDEVKLSDPIGATVARYRMDGGRLRIQSRTGVPEAFVEPRSTGSRDLRIVEPGGNVLYELQSEPDGNLTLRDRAANPMYEIKSRDYGLKVEQPDGATHAKIRVHTNRISARDATGKTVFTTRDPIPAAVAACLTLNQIPLAYRVGLGLGIIQWGAGDL